MPIHYGTTVQVEAFDSEIESLQSNIKRKQKPPPRLAHLEESVNRHKTHIGRLEQIIRLLDNDALQPDELARVVNDEIPEYIERNQEDFDAYEVGCTYIMLAAVVNVNLIVCLVSCSSICFMHPNKSVHVLLTNDSCRPLSGCHLLSILS